MVSLVTQRERRTAQNLSFCYLCGKDFVDGDIINKDHVPPEGIFAAKDRDPLLLKTHKACNDAQTLNDEKIGQLIALRRRKVPAPERRRLQFALSPHGHSAVTNLNIDEVIWRCIGGFHAALYQGPAVGTRGSLVTPFQRAKDIGGRFIVQPLRSEQHTNFVQTIKSNRIQGNLDRIRCNKGQLTYECVWDQGDNDGPWICIFALDIYDWKDLGATPLSPPRGCAGFYVLPSGTVPSTASRGKTTSIIIPTSDTLDPFSR
jgi:hypothetical protein